MLDVVWFGWIFDLCWLIQFDCCHNFIWLSCRVCLVLIYACVFCVECLHVFAFECIWIGASWFCWRLILLGVIDCGLMLFELILLSLMRVLWWLLSNVIWLCLFLFDSGRFVCYFAESQLIVFETLFDVGWRGLLTLVAMFELFCLYVMFVDVIWYWLIVCNYHYLLLY